MDSKEEIQADIDSLLKKINLSLSTYIPTSTISRVNGQDTLIEVDRFFTNVFFSAQEVSENTSGAFDATVMPLVNAWGFGPADTILKDGQIIDSLRSLVGYRKVELENIDGKYYIRKQDTRIKIDFSAIAKGFGVDEVCWYFNGKGFENYMVDIGGELRAMGGGRNGDGWTIGLDKPYDDPLARNQELQAIFNLNNQAVATSGNYRNFYYRNGKKVSHEIDPLTGYPAGNNLLSVAVIAEDCMTADAYATAFMVMGKEKSLAYLEKDTRLGAYLIFADEEGEMLTHVTKNLKGLIMDED